MKKADFFSRRFLEKNNADNVGLKIELEVIIKESPLPPCQEPVPMPIGRESHPWFPKQLNR
jgi:hypothetical protein